MNVVSYFGAAGAECFFSSLSLSLSLSLSSLLLEFCNDLSISSTVQLSHHDHDHVWLIDCLFVCLFTLYDFSSTWAPHCFALNQWKWWNFFEWKTMFWKEIARIMFFFFELFFFIITQKKNLKKKLIARIFYRWFLDSR